MPINKTDFIVVGAGIIGMSVALELVKQGQKTVIFDSGKLGKQSSWAAGGILSSMSPWTEDPSSFKLSEQGKHDYLEYIHKLNNETGIDAELIKSGLVIIGEDQVKNMRSWAKNKPIVVTDDFMVNELVLEHALLLPEIYQIRPSRLLKALHKSLKLHNIPIFADTRVDKISINNNKFDHIKYGTQKIYADTVIICAGCWSQKILDNFNCDINIKPIHGQMLCVEAKKLGCKHIVLDGNHYMIPRNDDNILIGSTMEDIGFIKSTSKQDEKILMDWACSIFPELEKSTISKHWSGLRPYANRGKPYIGMLPEYENIAINSGHFRKGILQAFSSSRLLTDHLLGKESFMDIDMFGFS